VESGFNPSSGYSNKEINHDSEDNHTVAATMLPIFSSGAGGIISNNPSFGQKHPCVPDSSDSSDITSDPLPEI